MSEFPIFAADLEIRARGDGRTLSGRFPYSAGPGRRMATVSDRGRTRKERIDADAFGWSVRRFREVNDELKRVIEESADAARIELLRQELDRRNIHILSGHDYGKPLGDLRSGTATVSSTRESVSFDVELPPDDRQPSWMRDTVAAVQAGLAGGVSPGFRVPPTSAVADAEVLEPEPGNPSVRVRVVRQAILHELSIVTRPAYSETDINARTFDLPSAPREGWRRVWL